jgi:hypothetical protein
MRHEIVLAPEAAEDFKALKASDRATIRDAMEDHLRYEPTKTSKSRISGWHPSPADRRESRTFGSSTTSPKTSKCGDRREGYAAVAARMARRMSRLTTWRTQAMKEVPLSEMKDDLAVLRQAAKEEIVITRHGGRPAC